LPTWASVVCSSAATPASTCTTSVGRLIEQFHFRVCDYGALGVGHGPLHDTGRGRLPEDVGRRRRNGENKEQEASGLHDQSPFLISSTGKN
jgi:hypothetical protein